MARAVFQICHYSVEPTTNNTKFRRSQERSVQIEAQDPREYNVSISCLDPKS
jgi:hypothetical protein